MKYYADQPQTQDPKTNKNDPEFQNQYCAVSRQPNKKLVISGGQQGNNFKKVAQSKILTIDQPKPQNIKQQLSIERQKHAMITVNNHIQIGGGTNDRKSTLSDFYKFDMMNMQWEELANMLNKRDSFFFSEYRSKFILVAGGQNGLKNLDSIESQNIKLNKWSYLNIRLPKIDNLTVGWERIGLSIDKIENKDELYIFGGSYNFGDITHFNDKIQKVAMKDVFEVELDPKLPEGVQETAVSQREYKFTEQIIRQRYKDQIEKKSSFDKNEIGHIRMFEKVGSKNVMLMIRHEDAKGNKVDGEKRASWARSLWFLQVYDFEDHSLERLSIEDLAKEKKGNNPDELSTEDEKDVYAACITY